MSKLLAILDVLRKGNAVANPTLWKNGGNVAAAVSALLTSALYAARMFGFEVPVSVDEVGAIGVSVAALAHILLTSATSDKVGILPAKPEPDQTNGFINPLNPDNRG